MYTTPCPGAGMKLFTEAVSSERGGEEEVEDLFSLQLAKVCFRRVHYCTCTTVRTSLWYSPFESRA